MPKKWEKIADEQFNSLPPDYKKDWEELLDQLRRNSHDN